MAKKLSETERAMRQSRAVIQATYRLEESYRALRDAADGRISRKAADASVRRMKRAVRKIERSE